MGGRWKVEDGKKVTMEWGWGEEEEEDDDKGKRLQEPSRWEGEVYRLDR